MEGVNDFLRADFRGKLKTAWLSGHTAGRDHSVDQRSCFPLPVERPR